MEPALWTPVEQLAAIEADVFVLDGEPHAGSGPRRFRGSSNAVPDRRPPWRRGSRRDAVYSDGTNIASRLQGIPEHNCSGHHDCTGASSDDTTAIAGTLNSIGMP